VVVGGGDPADVPPLLLPQAASTETATTAVAAMM